LFPYDSEDQAVSLTRTALGAKGRIGWQTLDQDFDMVIAGGGIAGLTAALAAARLGRNTFVLTGDVLGGLLLSIDKVDGFPGFPDGIPGYELCPMIQEQAVAAGAQFAAASVESIERRDDGWHLVCGKSRLRARAIILATGAGLKELEVPGAARLLGKGVSQCASCDAPLVRNRTVAVVGGGDSALQEALTLMGFAERVIILQRGANLTAQATYRARVADHPKIEIRCDTVVEEVLGADRVTGVRIRDAKGNAASDLEVAALFVYIGLQPATAFLEGRLQLDPSGRIPADARMRTELPGVFAVGIARSGSAGRAVAAAGDGTAAAVAAEQYLTDGDW
jgi:thioredoxin reductase (NADPH)